MQVDLHIYRCDFVPGYGTAFQAYMRHTRPLGATLGRDQMFAVLPGALPDILKGWPGWCLQQGRGRGEEAFAASSFQCATRFEAVQVGPRRLSIHDWFCSRPSGGDTSFWFGRVCSIIGVVDGPHRLLVGATWHHAPPHAPQYAARIGAPQISAQALQPGTGRYLPCSLILPCRCDVVAHPSLPNRLLVLNRGWHFAHLAGLPAPPSR